MTNKIAVLGALTAALIVPAAPAMASNLDAPALANTNIGALKIGSSVPETSKLVSPIKAGKYRLTSKQGARCIPVIGGSSFHEGQDFGASNKEPIYAVADGVVTKTRYGTENASGYIIVQTTIGGKRHDMAYIHMWNPHTHVKVGSRIKAGQQISIVGNSGPSTGPHLHFEIWDGAWYGTKSLDPIAFLKKQGLNLDRGATFINNSSAPTSCTYQINQATSLRATASSSAKVLKSVPRSTVVTSKPGTIINNMVPVNANGISGWVNRYAVSPYYGAPPKAPAPKPAPQTTQTVIHSKKVATGGYKTTVNVNLRSQAPSGVVLMTVPKGAEVTASGKTGAGGNWYQVAYGKTSGWISGTYLEKKATVAPVSSAKPKPVPKPAPVAKPVAPVKTMVTTGGLNLRAAAVDGKILMSMPRAAKVSLTGKSAVGGKWVQVKYSGKTGWVSKAYLASSAPAKPQAKPAPVVKAPTSVTTHNLNLRETALKGKVLATIPQGASVTHTGKTAESGRWVQVKHAGKTGWVAKSYLAAASAKTPSKAPAKPAPSKVKVTVKTTKSDLNMRDGASTKGKVVTTLKKGAKVTLLGSVSKSGWVKVKNGAKTGYVNSGYLV